MSTPEQRALRQTATDKIYQVLQTAKDADPNWIPSHEEVRWVMAFALLLIAQSVDDDD